MTIQDLKKERNTVLFAIPNYADKKKVMEYLVVWVENAKDIQEMKSTKKNVKKITKEAVNMWLKNDYNPTSCNPNEIGELNKQRAYDNRTSSMR